MIPRAHQRNFPTGTHPQESDRPRRPFRPEVVVYRRLGRSLSYRVVRIRRFSRGARDHDSVEASGVSTPGGRRDVDRAARGRSLARGRGGAETPRGASWKARTRTERCACACSLLASRHFSASPAMAPLHSLPEGVGSNGLMGPVGGRRRTNRHGPRAASPRWQTAALGPPAVPGARTPRARARPRPFPRRGSVERRPARCGVRAVGAGGRRGRRAAGGLRAWAPGPPSHARCDGGLAHGGRREGAGRAPPSPPARAGIGGRGRRRGGP